MKNTLNTFLVCSFVLMIGCSTNVTGHDEKEIRMQSIFDETDRCMKEKSFKNEAKSACYFDMYKDTERLIPDQSMQKAPVLKALRRLYLMELQVENKSMGREYARAEMMSITNDLRVDLREAEYRSAVINAAEAQRQRQLFQAAQQFLTPPASNVKTCTPQQGGPNGTFVCN